ncbi:uncharacterized protein MAM_06401 [Metarhizium album ARSEF 1941]|uniref:Uncharacterized protein n=1 Tax=Metarhizium album (strain ARSEF 1941) TaxID=1081103 RepID=A0A0B2WQA0_METAS|nr:uncharacterized protein MAM_06401 [Metarhizium album ARSEF 1941]KHN95789.1 hypothetical protein MAM_06401 [Metarhizium album ARSEF 1941]
MYPDWPESAADLVPLPRCDGPKLKAFPFPGPQKMEFLEYLGEGLHAHVFKIRISGQVYALKLFRFVYDGDWLGPSHHVDPDDLEGMSAFYNYSEPFTCECRAFGRLQEAGHEELAVRCYGYLLLDEDHERAVMTQFGGRNLSFNGNIDFPDGEDMRSRFLGKDGRAPPIRGIVKEFGPGCQDLRTRDARRILRHVVRLQQLGIIQIDVGHRQLIGGKFADFSTAITVPHFVTTPELNPRLTPEGISAMEFETFQFSINDYWDFDDMVNEWNDECGDHKRKISVYAFPNGLGCRTKYKLRSTPSRGRVFSFVDPRLYDWRTFAASPRNRATRTPGGGSKSEPKTLVNGGAVSKTRLRLLAKPPRWYLDFSSEVAANLKGKTSFSNSLEWDFKDGLIVPLSRMAKHPALTVA